MPHAGEHHRYAGLVRGGDNFIVPYRSARLHDCRDAGLRRQFDVVREREERIRRQCAPGRLLTRRPLRQMHADHAVGLAGAHAHQLPVFHECDGVGLDVLHRLPRKGKVGQFGLAGRPLACDSPLVRVFVNGVRRLHQHPAAQRPHVVVRRSTRRNGGIDRQNPQVPLALQDFQRIAVVSGGHYHFVKYRLHRLRRCRRDLPVEPDDAAERRHRVALVGQLVRLRQVVPRGQPARVRVLDYARRRLVIVADRPPGRVRVHQVVER